MNDFPETRYVGPEAETAPAFDKHVLPFCLRRTDGDYKEKMVNSEIKHECWYIENPVSKELTKRITLKLGAHSDQDFVIVVKSPHAKQTQNLLSILNISLLSQKNEKFGVKQNFQDFLAKHFDGNMKAFLHERRDLSALQRVQVLIAGRVQVPKLMCLKEVLREGYPEKVIPLALRPGCQVPIQRFKFQFKTNLRQEVDVDFQFIKYSSSVVRRSKKAADPSSEQGSPIEFSVSPTVIKVGSEIHSILNVTAKFKNSYLLNMANPQARKPDPALFNHLLIGRIKETQVLFSFIVQAFIIEPEEQSTE